MNKRLQGLTKKDLLTLLKSELARREFWKFCLLYDPEFFKRRPFLQRVAEAMQRVADGQIKRLAVSLPPRAGKSYLSTLFCAWLLGRNPSGSIMRNTCTATLYNKFSYDTRAVMRSEKYGDIFPDLYLSDDKQNLQGWSTNQAIQVSYFGNGVGGTIIGFGATILAMTDDLFKSFEEAISEAVRDKTFSWYVGSHMSRLEKDCPTIDIGTRWSKKDIIGQNMIEGYYEEIIQVPALTPEEKSFCEDVKSTQEYHQLRKKTPKEIWCAEYMQEPIEAAGTLFTRDDLNRFSLKQLISKLTPVQVGKNPKDVRAEIVPDAVLGYIDVADEGTDRLAFGIAVVVGKRSYLVDILFSDAGIDITVPLCIAMINKWNPDFVRVEGNNQGVGFARDLRRDLADPSKILIVKNVTNKHSRILMEYGHIKEYVHFIQDDELEKEGEYALALEQTLEYSKMGTSKKDDAPDMIAGLSKFIISYLPHLFTNEEHAITEEEER